MSGSIIELDDLNNNDYLNNKRKNKQIKSKEVKNTLLSILTDLQPIDYMLNPSSVIIKSTLKNNDSNIQMMNIVNEFNNNRKSIMTESIFGKRIDTDSFRLVSLNNQPELIASSNKQYRKKIYLDPKDKTIEHGIFKQTELFFGACGSYVINVPVGHIVLAWRGNNPIILGEGPHVIHDQNFRCNKEKCLVSLNSKYIEHGTYRLIRVGPNEVKKCWINSEPYFLLPSDKLYVFNEAVFEYKLKETKTVADISIKNKSNSELLSSNYINHGNYNILQIPRGKIAKIYIGSVPLLLESRDEPYLYNDRTFKLIKNNNELFFDATDRVIIHGSIKRLLPRTGEVAITYNNGKLVTYSPSENNEPIIITDQNHAFDGFISTNIQTIQFPSEKTKEARKLEAKYAKTTKSENDDLTLDDIKYEVFRTSDGLPIGVKLLVVYQIAEPTKTLEMLDKNNIINHIENIVVADMGMVIQSSTSNDFLRSNQSEVKKINDNKDLLTDKDTTEFYEHLQDKVKNQLCSDFEKYGIKLVRLNIETPKILDNTISTQMAKFSLMNTESKAKEAVLERNFKISQKEAEQNAMKIKIQQERENENKVASARALQESLKLEAEGKYAATELEIKGKQLLLDIARQKAELYSKYPGLLQKELAEIQAESIKGIQTTVISPDVAGPLYGLKFDLFKK